jgi:hypothetical protein
MSNFWKTAAEPLAGQPDVALGVWLMLSPWILGLAPETTPIWGVVLTGAAIALVALGALIDFISARNGPTGPSACGSSSRPGSSASRRLLADATWSFVAVGVLTIAFAAWSLRAHMAPAG